MTQDGTATFLRLPAADLERLGDARLVVLGASEASPYKAGVPSHSANGPSALRQASLQFAGSLAQFDFDLEATLLPSLDVHRGMVDAGDVATSAFADDANRNAIEASVRRVLAAGAVPIVLGGDDSVPIPVLKAFEGHGPITVLQIDAHVDWADVIQGNPNGYGSTMRRASEFPWVVNMVQVGIRGLGSGEAWQHDDARAWGSELISSYRFHREGVATALRHIPDGSKIFISIDCDGIDPAVCPAVNMPTPGGLGYEDLVTLFRGAAAKGTIVGLALVEYVPERDDRHQLSGLVAARLAAVIMGLALS